MSSSDMQQFTITFEDNGDAPYNAKGLKVPHSSVVTFTVPLGAIVGNMLFELYTNYPIKPGVPFERSQFHIVQSEMHTAQSDWTAKLTVTEAGTFSYYILSGGITKCKMGNFYVDPVLSINGCKIPIEAVTLQTVLPKCLGSFDLWEDKLGLSALSGYNMIHFTPVQELGTSQSSYSIYDQLQLNSKLFPGDDDSAKWKSLSGLVKTLETKFNMLSITDLVWNHTADNSPWLVEHPEAGYNLENSPHLKAAFDFDEAIMQFSLSITDTPIKDESDLANIMQRLTSHVLPQVKLWEYFVIDVETHVQEFRHALQRLTRGEDSLHNLLSLNPILHTAHVHPDTATAADALRATGIYSTGTGERFHTHVKLESAITVCNYPVMKTLSPEEVTRRCQIYESALNVLNVDLYREYDECIEEAVRNMTERVRFEFVSSHGPQWGRVTKQHPILTSLFTRINVGGKILPLANNGWIYNGNPLIDFAGPHSNAYLKRSVIAWGDCVKLRYGTGPSDSPWLWQHMAQYTTKMAKIFHGFRIDNCHSTPIHVAQYLLDAARSVRPNIYVVCELFTGSEEIDALYVSQLGISSLIREAMGANDSWELGRLCYHHGGDHVGSFLTKNPAPLQPCLPGALFMDCTHDNETPAQKRTPEDALPNAAIVAMAVSAVGSVRGYDELYPKLIDVVRETRQYPPTSNAQGSGIIQVKYALNKLHQQLAIDGYSELHVHQEGNIIAIQRHHPTTHEAVYMVAHTAFNRDYSPVHSVRIPGKISELSFLATVSGVCSPPVHDPNFLFGLDANLHFIKGDDVGKQLQVWTAKDTEEYQEIQMLNFPPGSVLVLKVSLPDYSQDAIQHLHTLLQDDTGRLADALSGLNFVDLNVLMYKCPVEEKATTGNGGYHVANYGDLVYCGLQGIESVMTAIATNNDLGHPVCGNLRDGNWMMDYTISRLKHRPSLINVAQYLSACFEQVKQLPRYLIPKHFAMVISTVVHDAMHHAMNLMEAFVRSGSPFIQALALTSVSLYGIVDSVLINNPEVLPPVIDNTATLAAGLQHFATGYMRSWGRDTFISLKGLFLVTGRFVEARLLILAYAACVRHGLIPNLLDSGVRPRYNARDAVWWFLQAIQDYCTLSPEGTTFMTTPIVRLFARDKRGLINCTLAELVHEILQKHASGIHFREWEAGTAIDDRMQNDGFNVHITLNLENGFLYGGNVYNCGTWMDKMGESSLAGNRGFPATPRAGAPIEITGLLKSTLRWLTHLHQTAPAIFPFDAVTVSVDGVSSKLLLADWNARVHANFDLYYYIPENPDEDSKHKIAPELVNRRGIYKDIVGSPATHVWAEYQLRPNQCVAMAVAPELFPPHNALSALKMVEDVLIKGAPLGVRTLDPKDNNYNGNYTNSDGTDYKTAGGFNYHNGPEWVWPLGYFLEAQLIFFKFSPLHTGEFPVGHMIHKFLRHHRSAIALSHYRGLPELTNADGAFCSASCDIQAWSSASILSALHRLHTYHQ